ncbi:hypothetical protein [Oligoflexus tunisiensis]|uniref:hypothetical protein n=1 Tax=Oligoflexus tunisiensis TaxID=708132 RepID=UPI00114D01C5|nr:hypothetical protein [Oligoflexus tunisiensis]
MKLVHRRTLASLFCVAALGIACKNENFGKTPSSNNDNKNLAPAEATKAPGSEKEIIPRVEYPGGDPSDFTNFEVGEEASIATDITGTYLSIPKGIVEAGKAIAIRTKEKVADAAVQAVKVVIPKNAVPSEENMVVLYHMTSEKGESFYGLIPKKDLEIKENSVTFHPKGLGVYQAAVLPVLITEPRQVPVLAANGPRLKLLSTYNTTGIAQDIVLDGATAYVADGTGVEVLNWSPAAGLSANTRVAGTGNINSILLASRRIYVAAGNAGLGVIDLANPATMQMADARGVTNGIAVAENFNNIYLTQEGSGDEESPAGISRFDIQQLQPSYETTGSLGSEENPQNAYAIQISGTVAYGLSRTGLYSFDITQNDRINQMSQIPLDGSAEKLLFHANRIYTAEKSTGITAVDAINPAALSVLGRLALPQVLDIAASGKYLIAVDALRKVSLIDIADPSHPLVLNQLTLAGLPTRVRVFGDTIFVTMGDTGVAVLALETPTAP